VNSFSSRRDDAIKSGQHFPLADFTAEENLGHDLFYGKARCVACHNGVPRGDTPDPQKGEARRELYTDNAFHNIGVPFNREIPGVLIRQKVGLSSHVPANNLIGLVKTPTLRNVAKGLDGSFVKAFAHNGYFKTLKGIVHFYNTRDSLRARTSPSSGKCEERGLLNATEAEALKFDCWPPAEFPETQAGFVVGNLGLTVAEENAIVAYMTTLIDKSTPTPP
jgi:cytochrome c peroxidase